MTHLSAPILDSPPLARYGLPDVLRPAAPAAGASFSARIGGDFYHRLLGVRCKLVTSATVASRQVVLQYLDDGDNVIMESGASTALVASSTGYFVFSPYLGVDIYTVGQSALAPLAPLLLPPTYSWKLLVTNIDTTDALTEIVAWRERFYTTEQPPISVPGSSS